MFPAFDASDVATALADALVTSAMYLSLAIVAASGAYLIAQLFKWRS
jgi:hypothetical protein